jgi:hypothetical protein
VTGMFEWLMNILGLALIVLIVWWFRLGRGG